MPDLRWTNFDDDETILRFFQQEGAYWMYEGEPSPEKPHAELTSGLHSNGFFDCLRVLCYPDITEKLARNLSLKLKDDKEVAEGVDWVVSSSYAAITFGHEVAKNFLAKFLMAEKDPNISKGMLWQRMAIPEGSRVLQVEELITTSGTFQEVRRAVEMGNPYPVEFLSVVGALVHRPELLPKTYDSRKVIALVEREIQAFEPEDCPYCKVKSPAYRPKINWRELTGR